MYLIFNFFFDYQNRLGIYLFVKPFSTAAVWEQANNGEEPFGMHRFHNVVKENINYYNEQHSHMHKICTYYSSIYFGIVQSGVSLLGKIFKA
jgi:uncharacterized protein with LGFP repeats